MFYLHYYLISSFSSLIVLYSKTKSRQKIKSVRANFVWSKRLWKIWRSFVSSGSRPSFQLNGVQSIPLIVPKGMFISRGNTNEKVTPS